MLVFSRRKGQRIVISNEIEIIVTQTSRTSVKLAVRAPAHCAVLRGEVFDAIVEANRAAADSPLDTAGAASAGATPAEAKPAEAKPAEPKPAEPSASHPTP